MLLTVKSNIVKHYLGQLLFPPVRIEFQEPYIYKNIQFDIFIDPEFHYNQSSFIAICSVKYFCGS